MSALIALENRCRLLLLPPENLSAAMIVLQPDRAAHRSAGVPKMRIATAVLIALVAAAPVLASAQEPILIPLGDRDQVVALMAEYAGRNWIGRGESRGNFDDPLEEASCRVDATFDVATATLTNTGRCATTARAVDVDGTVTVTPDGELAGGYFSRFERAELLNSTGFVHETGFVVEAHYRAEIRREVEEFDVRISAGRPQIRADGRLAFALLIEVTNPDTGEFVPFSILEFYRVVDN
jgi:hypothetical protein